MCFKHTAKPVFPVMPDAGVVEPTDAVERIKQAEAIGMPACAGVEPSDFPFSHLNGS